MGVDFMSISAGEIKVSSSFDAVSPFVDKGARQMTNPLRQ